MGRQRDERGVVLPTALLVVSLVAVALAAVGFVLTAQPRQAEPVAQVEPSATSTPTPTATATPKPKPKKPAVNRKAVYVEVFNNSNIKGLAGRVAGQASSVGWNVVGSDNWYGTIDSSTVYFPEQLAPAGRLLAKDLGIARVKPAITPMRLDRLTVILTGPLG